MREILFRGKRVEDGEWIEGGLVNLKWYLDELNPDAKPRVAIIPIGETLYPHCEIGSIYIVDPITVGQFTGLYDSNGTKVFEGDIIGKKRCAGNIERLGSVEFGEFNCGCCYGVWGYTVEGGGGDITYLDEDPSKACVEVIGNIYDNAKLLKGEEK